jgi:hypothetical protein
VKDMIVVDVGHFAIFRWNLGEQDSRDRGEVACCYIQKSRK